MRSGLTAGLVDDRVIEAVGGFPFERVDKKWFESPDPDELGKHRT